MKGTGETNKQRISVTNGRGGEEGTLTVLSKITQNSSAREGKLKEITVRRKARV